MPLSQRERKGLLKSYKRVKTFKIKVELWTQTIVMNISNRSRY